MCNLYFLYSLLARLVSTSALFQTGEGSVCRAQRSGAGKGAYVGAQRSGADIASGAGDIALLGGDTKLRLYTKESELRKAMNRTFQRMTLGLALALVSIGVLFVSNASLVYAATATRTTSNSFRHVFGGFGIDTSNRANAAASDGVSEAQSYGVPADPGSALGQTFQSLHMHEVDSYLWTLLYEYECHRSHVVPHSGASCATDYPNMTSVSVLLSYVQSHLQQVASNPLVNAYWVLDDWPAWDTGSAQPI